MNPPQTHCTCGAPLPWLMADTAANTYPEQPIAHRHTCGCNRRWRLSISVDGVRRAWEEQ